MDSGRTGLNSAGGQGAEKELQGSGEESSRRDRKSKSKHPPSGQDRAQHLNVKKRLNDKGFSAHNCGPLPPWPLGLKARHVPTPVLGGLHHGLLTDGSETGGSACCLGNPRSALQICLRLNQSPPPCRDDSVHGFRSWQPVSKLCLLPSSSF